jgi:hypothetical protein
LDEIQSPENNRRKEMANENDWLKKILEKGETVRWTGSPQPYGLFDEAHRSATVASVVLALVVGAVLTGGYLWLCASRGIELTYGVVVFCLVVSLLILWRPISNKKFISGMKYAVTDRRLLALSTKSDRMQILPLPALDTARLVQAGIGTCHVLFGAPVVKAPAKKLPALAIYGQDAEGEGNAKTTKGMVFYNISADAGSAVHALLKSSFAAVADA